MKKKWYICWYYWNGETYQPTTYYYGTKEKAETVFNYYEVDDDVPQIDLFEVTVHKNGYEESELIRRKD